VKHPQVRLSHERKTWCLSGRERASRVGIRDQNVSQGFRVIVVGDVKIDRVREAVSGGGETNE